ncbi:alpha/beta fold hydrolase [Janibacter sp. GS2]|uniref:alpha/beta fold hydrolase n=1 Tax=Janibacter sp. GS2 TaxID=3442646 RepID=UPI003EBB7941
MKNSLAHERRGSVAGPSVLLVHGIGHRRQAWGRVPELLAERGYDVISVDLPGHGQSPPPARPDGYSMRSSVEQLERLCRELGVTSPHVVGNSLGGLMALHMAATARAESVVAISPAGFYPPHHLLVVGPELLMVKLGARLPQSIYRHIVASPWARRAALGVLYRHPERLSVQDCLGDAVSLRSSRGFWPHFVRATFHRFSRQPRVPTTIAWGEQDRMLLPAQAEVARTRFRDNPLVSVIGLPDAGHCGQVDQPDEVAAIIERSIERSGVAGPLGLPRAV